MKRFLLVLGLVLIMAASASAITTKTLLVTLTWDGNDSSGVTEASMPVTIEVFQDGTTPILKSTATVTGPVTNFAMPTFTIDVPDNGSLVLTVFATAKDSAVPPNTSARSVSKTVTLTGKDTLAPGTPVINITVQ